MKSVAETAQRRNAHDGLDQPARTCRPDPATLSRGGVVIYRLTRRAPETCNALAELAGLGREYDHAR